MLPLTWYSFVYSATKWIDKFVKLPSWPCDLIQIAISLPKVLHIYPICWEKMPICCKWKYQVDDFPMPCPRLDQHFERIEKIFPICMLRFVSNRLPVRVWRSSKFSRISAWKFHIATSWYPMYAFSRSLYFFANLTQSVLLVFFLYLGHIGCEIGDKGVEYLVEGLNKNSTLLHLGICGKNFFLIIIDFWHFLISWWINAYIFVCLR